MKDNKVDKRDFSAVPQGALKMMCGISEAAATAGVAWAAGLRAPLPVLHDKDQTHWFSSSVTFLLGLLLAHLSNAGL